MRMVSETLAGLRDLAAGQLRIAGARFCLALHAIASPDIPASGGRAYAGVQYAGVLYEMGNLAQAERLLNEHLPIANAVGLRDPMIVGHVMLARMALHRGQLDRAWQQLCLLEQTGRERGLARMTASAQLERAHLLMRQGDAHASRAQLVQAAQPGVWERAARLRSPAHDIDDLEMGWLRWNLAFGDAPTTAQQILGAQARAQAERRLRRALKLHVLHALALQRMGQAHAALDAFAKLLSQAAAQGFVRLVLDEGKPAHQLAVQLQLRQASGNTEADPVVQEHLDKIARMAGTGGTDAPSDALEASDLTAKELRTLRLVADGLSNSELAVKLFVSDSAVRTRLRNINRKLSASNRTQAVAIARKLGLIA